MCVLVSFEKSVRPRGERKIWLWNLEPDYTNRAGSLYRKLGTLLKRNKNQLCDDNQASPVSWDPHIVMPGSRVEIFQVITLAGRPGKWTKWETGQWVTHCSCALLPRLMWSGPYCELYCHAVCTWKLWNLPLSWFVYERTRLNLINLRVLNRSRFALKNVGLCPFYCSTVKECNLFTRSFCSIRF